MQGLQGIIQIIGLPYQQFQACNDAQCKLFDYSSKKCFYVKDALVYRVTNGDAT